MGSDMTSAIETAEVRTDRQPIANRFPRLGPSSTPTG
jgi:hypothetical protein